MASEPGPQKSLDREGGRLTYTATAPADTLLGRLDSIQDLVLFGAAPRKRWVYLHDDLVTWLGSDAAKVIQRPDRDPVPPVRIVRRWLGQALTGSPLIRANIDMMKPERFGVWEWRNEIDVRMFGGFLAPGVLLAYSADVFTNLKAVDVSDEKTKKAISRQRYDVHRDKVRAFCSDNKLTLAQGSLRELGGVFS